MAERCQWLFDKVMGYWHLPGCWGAVHAGPDGCYCESDPESDDPLTLRDRIDGLEAKLDAILRGHDAIETADA